MTGESLSSYYEEQKGGKKVEIGGEKGGTGDGTRKKERVALSLRPRGDEEGWKKGKGAGPLGKKRKKGEGRTRASSALICLDTNLFPRPRQLLPRDDGRPLVG